MGCGGSSNWNGAPWLRHAIGGGGWWGRVWWALCGGELAGTLCVCFAVCVFRVFVFRCKINSKCPLHEFGVGNRVGRGKSAGKHWAPVSEAKRILGVCWRVDSVWCCFKEKLKILGGKPASVAVYGLHFLLLSVVHLGFGTWGELLFFLRKNKGTSSRTFLPTS